MCFTASFIASAGNRRSCRIGEEFRKGPTSWAGGKTAAIGPDDGLLLDKRPESRAMESGEAVNRTGRNVLVLAVGNSGSTELGTGGLVRPALIYAPK